MDREDIEFVSGGERCAAWLYRPEGATGDRPCVVLAHGFSAVRDQRLGAFAERFSNAGLAALVFDYRHFGDSEGQPRQLLNIRRQLDDWRAAVAHARSLDGIDPERVAIWGTSFAGGHVMSIAAEDARIAAGVCQVPFADGLVNLPSLGAANAIRLSAHGIRDQARAILGRAPYMVRATGSAGTTAVMTTPDAVPGFLNMTPEGSTWRNEVAARITLRIAMYRPGRQTRKIRCPLLVCIAEDDAITPIGPAIKAAEAAPKGELRRYPGGHFDYYVGDRFEQIVADQRKFLAEALL